MNELWGKKVLIFQQRRWGVKIGHFLAKKLQAEGCRLSAFTYKKSTHKFITEQTEVKYEHIVNIDAIYEDPAKILNDESISLKEICQQLNIDSVWPILSSNRKLVKSYKEKFYYSYRQNVSDEFIVLYTKANYKVMRDLLIKFKPDIIITANIAYDGHIVLSLLADKYKIPLISITDVKVRGYAIFFDDYKIDRSDFHDLVDGLNNAIAVTPSRDKAQKYIQEFRESFKKPKEAFKHVEKVTFKQKIRHELSPYYRILRWYLKGHSINSIKTIDPSIDYRPPKIMLRDHYCYKKYRRFMDSFNYYPFDKVEQFVYYPLQSQPEATTDLSAPYFSNQIETARLIAMSLPDDYTLVVKDHPVMKGLRTPSYLEKVARTPNVKLIDYRISSEKIFKKADLIISLPNSTSLAEAAFYCKPAIQLGGSGITLKLPNVYQHSDMTTLSQKIKEVLKIDLRNEDYERRLENYVAAAYDLGFEFDYWGVWERNEQDDMGLFWRVWKKELEKKIT